MGKFISGLFGLGLLFLLIAVTVMYSAFVWGYVVMNFWNWFVQPVFVGMPILLFYQAIGISLFIDLFKYRPSPKTLTQRTEEKYNIENITNVVISLIIPWFVLLIGYLINVNIING